VIDILIEALMYGYNLTLLFFCIIAGIACIIQHFWYKYKWPTLTQQKPRKYNFQVDHFKAQSVQRDPFFAMMSKLSEKRIKNTILKK
jgi:hypothetical protein